VPRHENAVLRRQAGRIRYQPADRLRLAPLSRLIPRRRWGEVSAVSRSSGRLDPRHHQQHSLRIHRVPEDCRPSSRPTPGPRTSPLRPPHHRTRRRGGRRPKGRHWRPARRLVRSAGTRRTAARRTQTQQQALSNADHLAILRAIWTLETIPAREDRYKKLLMDALPPGYRQEPGHQAKWLWRTMRAAELAGLDSGPALARRRRAAPDRSVRCAQCHRRSALAPR
jgi:hypothetical protein